MSEHTPQQHHEDSIRPGDAATVQDTGVDPNMIDLVAGNPPVPITVWRTARTDADLGRSIPARLAARLLAAYSRPGEAVVDLTDDHALTAACAAGGRRHHRAWFTDASSIIIGPATPPAPTKQTDNHDTAAGTDDGCGADEVPELSVWFGDDLTDPDLPPPAEPPVPLPDSGSMQRATSLVVACWPLDSVDAANRVRLAWLLTACAALLRRGGCLILVVGIPAGITATPEDFSPLVTAAANAGLGYLQHIVAVAAGTDGDAFIYHVTDEELLTLAHTTSGQQWPMAHLRVHADLLVFSQARFPASSAKLTDPHHEPKGSPPDVAGRDGGRRG